MDSKYVISTADEAKLNSVVSNALDRLHSSNDPPVRYDQDQKLWIYLHRLRTVDDYKNYETAKRNWESKKIR